MRSCFVVLLLLWDVIGLCAGVLPAAVTCVSLALADASIELFDLVAACSVVRLSARAAR